MAFVHQIAFRFPQLQTQWKSICLFTDLSYNGDKKANSNGTFELTVDIPPGFSNVML